MGYTGSQRLPSVLERGSRWHDVAYWAVLLAACAVFLVMNVLTTFKEDDMAFSLVEGEWTPVHNVLDLLRSHINLFEHANGRTANLVAALFCALLGKTAFNVCNTLIFGALAHLLSLLATGRRSLLALSMFLVTVGTCYPVPGETMLWLDGSCNYMWAITLSLAFIFYLLRNHESQMGWAGTIMLLLAAFVAGSFNEATSWGFLLGLVLYFAFNRSRLDRRAMVALVGYTLGVALIIASSGAWSRAATGDIAVNMGAADLLHSRWYIFSEKMWRFYLPVFACIVGVAVVVFGHGKAVKQSVWTYVFVSLALVMFALGQTSERTYAPLVTVALIIITIVADRVLARWPWARLAAIVVCLGLAGFTAARGIVELKRYKAYDDKTVAEILASPDQAVLLERTYDSYSRFIKPMNFISTNFFAHEDIYRAFHGKKNIQFVSDSVFARYQQGRLLDGAKISAPKTNHPDLLGRLYAFDDQDYIAVEFKSQILPGSFQTAELHSDVAASSTLSDEEAQRRHNYGINIDYEPAGFYPLRYQGQCYLICEAPATGVTRIIFPIWLHPGDTTIPLEIAL